MNDNSTKKERNLLSKLLLVLSIITFLSVGSYSIYKIIISKNIPAVDTIRQENTPNPTAIVSNGIIPSILPTAGVTTSISITPTITPITNTPYPSIETQATPTVTAIPSKKPTSYPSPTQIITIFPSVTPTVRNSLPDAGYPTPFYALFTLGIILVLPIIFLL